MTDQNRYTPRQTLNQRTEEVNEDRKEEFQTKVKAFQRLAQTPDGLFVLQEIFKESLFGQNHLTLLDTGDIASNLLFTKQGRASLWLDLRKYFSRENLIAIEYPETKGQKS